MLKLDEVFNGIHFDVLFEDKVNLLSGVSGEGKTFLFMVLDEYFMERGVSCVYFNSDNTSKFSENAIKEACIGKSVIIFDNADLYLTQDLLDLAVETADIIIVSMKVYCRLRFNAYNFYVVRYNNNDLVVRMEFDI